MPFVQNLQAMSFRPLLQVQSSCYCSVSACNLYSLWRSESKQYFLYCISMLLSAFEVTTRIPSLPDFVYSLRLRLLFNVAQRLIVASISVLSSRDVVILVLFVFHSMLFFCVCPFLSSRRFAFPCPHKQCQHVKHLLLSHGVVTCQNEFFVFIFFIFSHKYECVC